MAVNTPNPGVYFQQLGSDVTNFRDALARLINDGKYLNSIGGSAALQAAPFNLSPQDAANVMNTVGTVTPTNATVVSVQAFIDSTEFLWGGQ